MYQKSSIDPPANNSRSLFSEGLLSEDKRFSLLAHLQPTLEKLELKHITTMDPVVVSGVWSLIRTSCVPLLFSNGSPEYFVEDVDSVNIDCLMEVVKENMAVFGQLILKDEFIRRQFETAERVLFVEQVPLPVKYNRCLITGLPMEPRSQVDKIIFPSKTLYVHRAAHWGQLTTLELFQLAWHMKEVKQRVTSELNTMIGAKDEPDKMMILNRLSSLEDVSVFMITLILEFRQFDDILAALNSVQQKKKCE